MLNLNMKPTGWFQIGWSRDIAPGGVKPLRYFGQDMVAFRTDQGELAVMEAHCPHLGAHLGHGGRVKGDCIECPYHGWRWSSEGDNVLIPLQDRTVRRRLRKWPVVERNDGVFLWHDPNGGPPREGWEVPDLFALDALHAAPADYYASVPGFTQLYYPNEPIHPQLIVENSADSAHFHFTHGSPEHPELVEFDGSSPLWRSQIAFLSPKTKQVAMRGYAFNPGVGLSFFVFDHGAFGRRLILSATPVDDSSCDLRVTYFFPKDPQSPDVMPERLRVEAEQTRAVFEQDANIWRHQKFVCRPLFSDRDVRGYSALRRWSAQFYELEDAAQGPTTISDEELV